MIPFGRIGSLTRYQEGAQVRVRIAPTSPKVVGYPFSFSFAKRFNSAPPGFLKTRASDLTSAAYAALAVPTRCSTPPWQLFLPGGCAGNAVAGTAASAAARRATTETNFTLILSS